MKILQINKYYYRKGGSETVFFNTIQMLEKHGHTVIPFALKSEKNLPTPFDKYFVDFPELSESGFWTKIKNMPSFIYNKDAAKQLDRLLKIEKPDIAHIHLFLNGLSVSILPVLKRHKIPVVMSVHDYRLICPVSTFLDRKGKICERCIGGHFYNCTLHRCYHNSLFKSFMLTLEVYFRKYIINPSNYIDHFIPVSCFAQNKLKEYSLAFGKKSSVLYNCTNVQGTAIKSKENYILYLGRISEEKGIQVLLESMLSMPEVELKIAGTGPLYNYLQKDGTPPNIKFLGFKSGNELENLIRQALFVVVPSIWYENNPMSVIEALILGTPVIASRLGGLPELIKDGENGFLFEPDSASLTNCIQKAINLDSFEYRQMCEKAQSFANEHFNEKVYYPKILDIYNSVLSQ